MIEDTIVQIYADDKWIDYSRTTRDRAINYVTIRYGFRAIDWITGEVVA